MEDMNTDISYSQSKFEQKYDCSYTVSSFLFISYPYRKHCHILSYKNAPSSLKESTEIS